MGRSMSNLEPRVRLNDPIYNIAARERVRQMGIWSPGPVLLSLHMGLPRSDEESIAKELELFEREHAVRMWQYRGDPVYEGSIGGLSRYSQNNEVLEDDDFRGVIRYVDERLESIAANASDFGFRNAEGMLLEQVVLR